ncbi:MAG: hypothetical protein EXS33_03665 [Pedosphaera sp.]|nr:hypothetical protein [Pedosphaera sp.]
MPAFAILANADPFTGGLLLAASIEGLLILLVIAAASAFFNWLKKKGEADGSQPAPPPIPGQREVPPPPPPPQAQNWEEELRKLLQGEEPAPPPPPPRLPPLIVHQPRRVPPPPPVPVEEESPAPPMFHPTPVLNQSAEAFERARRIDETAAQEVDKGSTLAAAAQAFLVGSQLDDRMAEHLRQVTLRPVGKTGVTSAERTAEAAAALELIRNPRSVRTAMIASVILGPPRALAE